MRKYLFAIASLVLIFSVLAVAARPDLVPATVNPSGATVTIPEHAVEVAPGIFSLGTAVHQGKVVQGYAMVHYKEEPGKPSGCNNDGKCQGWEDASCGDCSGGVSESSCYGFLSKGAKWKTLEPYMVNPSNIHGLSSSYVMENLASDVEKWETAASYDILGPGSLTLEPLEADLYSPDDRNEIYFGSIEDSNAIAITIVWGYFNGRPSYRELVEWDQVYDQVDFGWSATGEPDKMDFESIATHELGHSVGLDDLYNSACSEETMYGYASEGETNKRTLEAGDIEGARKLYS